MINGSALAGGGTVTGGTLSPNPTPFKSGDIAGTIRRYVVWINDPKCPDMVCPGAQDLKRVIVAATLDSTAAGGDRAYEELHTDIVDPDVSPVVDSVPEGDGEEGSFATFWLTDTPCSHDERQDPTGDHATHNTLGDCSAGAESGDTLGAPDLMFTEPPPLDARAARRRAAALRLLDGRRARDRSRRGPWASAPQLDRAGLRLLAEHP